MIEKAILLNNIWIAMFGITLGWALTYTYFKFCSPNLNNTSEKRK